MIHRPQHLPWILATCLIASWSLGAFVPLRADDPLVKLSFAEIAHDDPQSASPELSALATTVVPRTEEQLVDLSTVLQLAQAQNPSIGLSRQAIQEALALQLQARGMMLPTLRAGANYHGHQGIVQTSDGLMRQVTESSLYLGNGAFAVGATTMLYPGIQIFAPLGDGVFEPLAARQLLASRRFQAEATTNQILLDVARRFLDLVRAEADLRAIRLSETDVNQAVLITDAFAKVKQGRQADARRAQATAALLHADETQAQENVLIASAELARVLSLSPSIRLRIAFPSDALLEMVDAQRSLEELLQLAQSARPELAALGAEIARKQTQVRQERVRPLLPTVSLGFSAGTFGGGTDRTDLVPIHPEFGRFGGRTDVDLIAYWTLENLGAGNLARVKQRTTERNLAMLEQERMFNLIRREVASAQASVRARQKDLGIAGQRLRIAERAFRLDFSRIKGNLGLPIELLNSLNRLTHARRDLPRVVRDYNLAQMQLFVALGQTPLAARVASGQAR